MRCKLQPKQSTFLRRQFLSNETKNIEIQSTFNYIFTEVNSAWCDGGYSVQTCKMINIHTIFRDRGANQITRKVLCTCEVYANRTFTSNTGLWLRQVCEAR